MKVKVGITLNDELMKRVDAYASANYMSRSAFISIAVIQYLSNEGKNDGYMKFDLTRHMMKCLQLSMPLVPLVKGEENEQI